MIGIAGNIHEQTAGEIADHAKTFSRKHLAVDGVTGERQAQSDIGHVHEPVGILVGKIIDRQRAKSDRLDAGIVQQETVTFGEFLTDRTDAGVAQRFVGIVVCDNVSVNIDEANKAKAIAGRDAGDLIEIDLVVIVQVGQEDHRRALFDKEQIGAVARGLTRRKNLARTYQNGFAMLCFDEVPISIGIGVIGEFSLFDRRQKRRRGDARLERFDAGAGKRVVNHGGGRFGEVD